MTAESADDTVTYYFSTVQIEADLWLVASNKMVPFIGGFARFFHCNLLSPEFMRAPTVWADMGSYNEPDHKNSSSQLYKSVHNLDQKWIIYTLLYTSLLYD